MEGKPYAKEELENVLKLVRTVKRIRQELRREGIPIDEYERVFIHGEDPRVVFGTQESLEQSLDKALSG